MIVDFVRRLSTLLILALSLSCLIRCGGGTAALVGMNRGGGSSNSPTVLETPVVFSTRSSPLGIALRIIDSESDSVDLEIVYRSEGGVERRATLVAGSITIPSGDDVITDDSLSDIPSSPEGLTAYKLWDFETDVGSGGLAEVELTARILGSSGASNPSAVQFIIGNEAPSLLTLEGLDEQDQPLSGIVPMFLAFADPLLDGILINVEYRIVEDHDALGTCEEPVLARSAEIPDSDEVSEPFPIDTGTTAPGGDEGDVELEVFFWDTSFIRSDPFAGCELFGRDVTVDVLLTIRENLESPDDTALETVIEIAGVRVTNSL